MPRIADLRQRFTELIPELARFGVVGATGAIIDLGGAAYLHGALGIGPLSAKALSITVATVVTYLGSRFWTFRHRVGLVIAEAVIALTTYGLGLKSALAYNAASVAGTGLGTIFRYFSYKKWVFLAPAPVAPAVAVAHAAPAVAPPVPVHAATVPPSYGPPWEILTEADYEAPHRYR